MPTRIQRKRTPGFRLPPNTICVNRGTKFGNPYKVSDYGREKAIQMFRDCLLNASMCYCYLDIKKAWIQYNRFIWMANNLHLIREADHVACFCPLDVECHGDVLIELSGIENER